MLRKLTPALLALALWAAWTPTPGRPEDRRLAVVATFSVLGDWVRNVGGDRVALRVLVGPDGDAHNFEPTPRDAVALARAALVFEIGLGYETWLDGLYRASRSRARRVAVTRGLALLYAGGRRPGRKEADPHVWHDASRAIRAVRNVRDALASADPAGAAVFEANADRYVAELRALDAWIARRAQAVPEARRVLVTAHNSLGYFAARYGFRIPGSARASLTTEASEPPAGRMAALVKDLRSARVPAVFPETLQSPKLMERLAAEAGVRLGPALYTGALGKRGTPGETYLKMMRHNVSAIVRALRP